MEVRKHRSELTWPWNQVSTWDSDCLHTVFQISPKWTFTSKVRIVFESLCVIIVDLGRYLCIQTSSMYQNWKHLGRPSSNFWLGLSRLVSKAVALGTSEATTKYSEDRGKQFHFNKQLVGSTCSIYVVIINILWHQKSQTVPLINTFWEILVWSISWSCSGPSSDPISSALFLPTRKYLDREANILIWRQIFSKEASILFNANILNILYWQHFVFTLLERGKYFDRKANIFEKIAAFVGQVTFPISTPCPRRTNRKDPFQSHICWAAKLSGRR